MIIDAKTLKTLVLTKDRAEEISDIKFSPGRLIRTNHYL